MAMEIIQNSGKIVISPRTSATSIQTPRTTSTCRRVMIVPSLIGEASPAGHEKEDRGHGEEDDNEDRRHRGSVANGAELKRLLVDIDDHDLRGVRRPPLGHDVNEVEGLRACDGGDERGEQNEEARGTQQRQRDVPETLDPAGAVDL